MTSLPQVWSDALRRIQNEIPDFAFDAWIAPLEAKIAKDRLVLGCPTSFHRDRVRRHHLEAIERCWQAALSQGEPDADSPEQSAPRTIELLTSAEFAAAEGHAIKVELMRIARAGMARVCAREAAAQVAVGAAEAGRATISRPMARGTDAARARDALHSLPTTPTRTGLDPVDGAERPAEAGPSPMRRVGRSVHRIAPGPAAPVRSDALAPRGPDAEAVTAEAPVDAPAFGLDGGPAPTNAPYSFESFIVGPCNALAREACLALARRRQQSLNQLYLIGGSGLGKTHLARATAAEARRHAGARLASASTTPFGRAPRPGAAKTPQIVYTTAERFTSEFVSAMRNGRNEAWRQRYRGPIELLVVEDIHFFAGRTKTQLELFHTIQHVLDAGGRVMLTGDRAAHDLAGLDHRLQAQVGRGFVAELDRPDALVRRHLLRAKASAGGVHLPKDCLDRLVEATGPSEGSERGATVRDVESVLIQVVTTASLLGRPIDLALTQEAIDLKSGGTVGGEPRRLEVAEIVRIVASFFGLRPETLASRSRRREVLVPRQLAMYLAHRYSDASLGEIGRALGRDHPSVRNAITRIERQVLENAPVRYQVETLSERIDALRDGDEQPR
jgi:chromosomal replication initiator protein